MPLLQSESRPARPAQEPEQLPCPRCDSNNTKFCYYNNYNLSQPRHFCKSCRRYWTQGGTLRNVPVGGGSRRSASATKRHRPSTDKSGAAEVVAVTSPTASSASCVLGDDISNWSMPVGPSRAGFAEPDFPEGLSFSLSSLPGEDWSFLEPGCLGVNDAGEWQAMVEMGDNGWMVGMGDLTMQAGDYIPCGDFAIPTAGRSFV